MKQLIAILLVLSVVIGYVLMTAYFNPEQIVEEPQKSEWCFKELMPYGQNMSITEEQGGDYQYTLYAAKQGVEVWVKCE